LYAQASGQQGYVTTKDAASAGFSSQLLLKHIRAGRVTHVRRGMYRLVHFPSSEHEELVVAWLWSDKQGVFSHQTALALHSLSDTLPAKAHLSLPSAWTSRRLRVPPDVIVHHSDVPKRDRTWFGAVPATSPVRTLADCAHEKLAPDLLRQAARDALRRGLVRKDELTDVRQALRGFGGLTA
jgi:predicted transcriptional regulator of viral defense system